MRISKGLLKPIFTWSFSPYLNDLVLPHSAWILLSCAVNVLNFYRGIRLTGVKGNPFTSRTEETKQEEEEQEEEEEKDEEEEENTQQKEKGSKKKEEGEKQRRKEKK